MLHLNAIQRFPNLSKTFCMFQKIKLRKLSRTKTQNLIVIQAHSIVMWNIHATTDASDRVRELSTQSVQVVDFKNRQRVEYTYRIEMLSATYLSKKIKCTIFLSKNGTKT